MPQETTISQISSEMRETALRGIAHDLRVPLTAILGYTEALQRGMDRTPEKRAAYLSAIEKSAKEMSVLIDGLSETAKSRDPFPVRPIPLRPAVLIRDCLSDWSETLAEKKVSVTLDLEETILLPLDANAFRRILSNLISNTIKYREKNHSEISISLYADETAVRLLYHDDGPGVSPAFLPLLFEAGARGEETAKKIPGSGLGFYIIERLTAAQQGTVSAKNNNGLAILFTFEKPSG